MSMHINVENICKNVKEFCNKNKLSYKMLSFEPRSSRGFTSILVYNRFVSREYYVYNVSLWTEERITTDIINDIKKYFYLKDEPKKTAIKKDKNAKNHYIPEIKDVIFNYPETIVLWEDGSKTSVRCSQNDEYSKEVGLALCTMKKAFGNTGDFNDIFRKWIPKENSEKYNKRPYQDILDSLITVLNFCKQMNTLLYSELIT